MLLLRIPTAFTKLFTKAEIEQQDSSGNEHAAEYIGEPVHSGNKAADNRYSAKHAAAAAKSQRKRMAFYSVKELVDGGAHYT